jgi:hypothetical protein
VSVVSKAWRAVVNTVAPRVCEHCEGGSGFVRIPGKDELQLCPACGGTGRPASTPARNNHNS